MLREFYSENGTEAGCDEAGRGCLAGPVFAAAVILPIGFKNSVLTDSKQLKEKTRTELRHIIETEALAWAVASCSHLEIDRLNILKASFTAMHRAVNRLKILPKRLVIDGNRFIPYPAISHVCVVKGDSKFLHIAAASVLAKTHRDEYMKKLHEEFPQYNWIKNKGYPTRDHRAAIEKWGVSCYHRKSFRLLPGQSAFEF